MRRRGLLASPGLDVWTGQKQSRRTCVPWFSFAVRSFGDIPKRRRFRAFCFGPDCRGWGQPDAARPRQPRRSVRLRPCPPGREPGSWRRGRGGSATGRRATAWRPRARRLVVGLSLRGAQGEYGASLCRDKDAEELFKALIERLARDREVEVVTLENHLVRAGKLPEQIEAQYRDCDLVLTTRFHGAVTALRAGVPFLAIDQIAGGAKVFPLLAPLDWPGLFRIDDATMDSVVRAGEMLVEHHHDKELSRARSLARRDANRTLRRLADWLDELPADVGTDRPMKGDAK